MEILEILRRRTYSGHNCALNIKIYPNNFSYLQEPLNMKMITGQKKQIARIAIRIPLNKQRNK